MDSDDDGLASELSETENDDHFSSSFEQADKAFELFGESKATFDFVQFIYDSKLSTTKGDALLKLLDKHGTDGNKGIHESCNSMDKIKQMLDKSASLPFRSQRVEVQGLVGDYTLYYRDILQCIKSLFATQAFEGKMHVRPVTQHDADGDRIYSDFFTGDFIHDLYASGDLKEDEIVILIILYSDKTHQDVLGVHEALPVCIHLGNVITAAKTGSGNARICIGEHKRFCKLASCPQCLLLAECAACFPVTHTAAARKSLRPRASNTASPCFTCAVQLCWGSSSCWLSMMGWKFVHTVGRSTRDYQLLDSGWLTTQKSMSYPSLMALIAPTA